LADRDIIAGGMPHTVRWTIAVVAVAAAAAFAALVASIGRLDFTTTSPARTSAAHAPKVRDAAPAPSPIEPPAVEAPPAATSDAAPLRFVVSSDGDDPRPIWGAVIKLRTRDGLETTITTNAAGTARFDAPASSVEGCEAHVTASGDPSEFSMLLHVENSGDIRVHLRVQGYIALKGRVLDGATGAPIADARISACQRQTATNADGEFFMERVWNDKPIYGEIDAPGHVGVRFEHDARSGPLTMWLDPAGRVVGTVRTRNGKPVAHAKVRAMLKAPGEFPTGLEVDADDHGAFVIDGLTLDVPYRMAAASKSEGSGSADVVMTTQAAPSVTRDLVVGGGGASLTVVVRDASGVAVPDAVVRVGARKDRTGPEGSVVFHPSATGRLNVDVWSDRFAETAVDVDVAKEETKQIEIGLPPAVEVAGVVVDDAGVPVAGAKLSVLAPSEFQNWGQCGVTRPGPFLSTTTADDGSFRVALPRRAGLEFDLKAPGHVLPDVTATTSDDLRFLGRRRKYPLLLDARPLRLLFPRAATFAFAPRLPPGISRDRIDVFAYDETGAQVFGDTVWNEFHFVAPVTARRVKFETWNMVPALRDVHPDAGAATDLGEIALDFGVPLRGRIVDDVGRPVGSATLTLTNDGGVVVEDRPARSDGTFEISGVPPGAVEMTIEAPGHVRWKRNIAADRRVDPMVVTLDRGADVTVRVLDAAGRSADHETLAVFGPGGVAPDAMLGRTTRGLWEGRLPSGSWRVAASRDDVRAEASVDVADETPRVVTIRLPR